MVLEHDIMKMRPIPRLDLPAGKPVALKPGGYHVMLMDLRQPLRKGESVPITLKVEGKDKSIRTVEVQAEVRDLTTPGHDSHSKH
jgi:copper(I)-binding protein